MRQSNHDRKESLLLGTRSQPPRAQRQSLQFLCGRIDKHHKGDRTNQHAEHVGHIVSVTFDLARTAAVDTAVLFWLEGAGECSSDEGILERAGRGSDCWGKTGCDCEEVDEFEDEDAGECSAQVADTGVGC